MKRDDVKKVFPDATDEQIDSLLNINSADIGNAKKGLDDVKKELETAKATITDLTGKVGNTEELQKIIDQYKQAEETREKEAREAQARAAMMERFSKAHESSMKDAKWANDYTKNGIFAEFEKAVQDAANTGKSDVQIFESIVKDEKGAKPGIFAPAVSGRMGGMGNVGTANENYMQSKYKGNPFFEG